MFKFTSFPDTELKFANILEGTFVSGEACRILLPKTLFLSWVLMLVSTLFGLILFLEMTALSSCSLLEA